MLRSPQSLGLYATRNFYITHRDPDDEQDIQIGVWHILPNYISKKFSNELNLIEVVFIGIFRNLLLFC